MKLFGYAAAALFAAAAVLLLHAPASAHGMHFTLETGETAQVFKAGFSGGEPAAYSECMIYGPGSDIEFQNGRTDATGRFAFVPDRDGAWRVEVDGGMGHRLEFEVEVNGTRFEAAAASSEHTGAERLIRAGLGVSVIANMFFVSVVLRRRRIN